MRGYQKKIYDNLELRLSKRNSETYWLFDIKDNSVAPQMVVQKYLKKVVGVGGFGKQVYRWRVYVHATEEVLADDCGTRKEAICFAEIELSKKLAGFCK